MQMVHALKHAAAVALALILSVSPLSAVAPAHAQADPNAIADLLINRSNEIIDALDDLRDAGNLTDATALELIQARLSPLFDFVHLTKLAVGKHWKKADEATRTAVRERFQLLLERTYAKVIAKYSGQDVILDEAKVGKRGRVLVSLLIADAARTVKIQYRVLTDNPADPRIADVKVEGVSLVANYRRQFSAIIRRHGFDALIEKLDELIAR